METYIDGDTVFDFIQQLRQHVFDLRNNTLNTVPLLVSQSTVYLCLQRGIGPIRAEEIFKQPVCCTPMILTNIVD